MKIYTFWKPLLWTLVICALSLFPAPDLPKTDLFNIPHFDKIVHFGMYFILCLFFIKSLKSIRHTFLIALIITISLGGFLELIQEFLTANRHGDYDDFIANTTGALCAAILYKYLFSDKKIERLF